MTFSRIFGSGDKKLQARADEILIELSKGLQSASAKMKVGAEEWAEGHIDVLNEIRHEIIELERDMDRKKEELMDSIIDTAEHAVRIMWTGRKFRPPKEIVELAKKCWNCTDLLQDAVKYLYSDFEKSVEITRKVDALREEARDIQFELMEEIFNEDDYCAGEIALFDKAAQWIVKVAVQSEVTGDFIRELAVKYS
jgi:uncharacterized protein Yka (UPF0111/DUF47 family)